MTKSKESLKGIPLMTPSGFPRNYTPLETPQDDSAGRATPEQIKTYAQSVGLWPADTTQPAPAASQKDTPPSE